MLLQAARAKYQTPSGSQCHVSSHQNNPTTTCNCATSASYSQSYRCATGLRYVPFFHFPDTSLRLGVCHLFPTCSVPACCFKPHEPSTRRQVAPSLTSQVTRTTLPRHATAPL